MSERAPRKQKAAPPKAVIQTGKLGIYPYDAVALSALHHGQVDCILAHFDDEDAKAHRNRGHVSVDGTEIILQDKLFCGFSDAFYRGKLPEVVLMTAPVHQLPGFLKEWVDYLDKLCQLGFLASTEDATDIDRLDSAVPLLVINTYGLVYEVISKRILSIIQNMDLISSRQREQSLRKFTRGLFTNLPDWEQFQPQRELKLHPTPFTMDFAGGKSLYTVQTLNVIESHPMPVNFIPGNETGITTIELRIAYHHVSRYMLPALQNSMGSDAFTQASLDDFMEQLATRLSVPTQLVFEPLEVKTDAPVYHLSDMDRTLVYQLRILAGTVGLETEADRLEQLLFQFQA